MKLYLSVDTDIEDLEIDYIEVTESDNDSDIVITDMTFEDEGEQYTPKHLLPYVISMEGNELFVKRFFNE